MLNWFISYFNYHGYYYCENYNYNSYNQLYTPPVRRISKQNMNKIIKKSSSSNNNQKATKPNEQPNRKAIEAANMKKGLETKIEQGNKGYDLLVKMGYQDGKGLGKNGEGIMEPLGIVNKTDRKGLGAPVATTTTEDNKNEELTRNQKRSLRRRRNQGNKTVGMVAHEAHMARELADKATKAAERAVEAANKAKQVAEDIKAAKKEKMEVDEVSKSRRKHSPIRAPTPTPPTTPITKTPIKDTTNSTSLTSSNAKTTKESFSIKDPSTPQFLRSLARCFQSEIKSMQLRLETAASRNPLHDDNELIVAKIIQGSNTTIAEHAFEFIRTDLIGWIGVYQEEGMDTPIFHSMTNNESHITVVCDNAYAYNCLEQCIDDIAQMKTMGCIKVVRLPPITPLIYCFDAIYEGVARDSALFLTQIHLHKTKLYSDNWVVVSHEVCPEERKTYFIFLVDERSALALNFHYSSNIFICMQKVNFRNRGIVTEE